jgi:hypothetical protein
VRGPSDCRLTLRLLLPGWSQYGWNQRTEGLALLGGFFSCWVVAVFGWGTLPGALVVGAAFGIHVLATVDALRQASFPDPGFWVSLALSSLGLGLTCYLPALILASVFAWPSLVSHFPPDGYLVNRGVYQGGEPRVGDRVWVRGDGPSRSGAAQVVATTGQRVEQVGDRLHGPGLPPKRLSRPRSVAVELAFQVPEGLVCVAWDAPDGALPSPGPVLELVPRDRIVGKIWLRIQPAFKRRFLAKSRVSVESPSGPSSLFLIGSLCRFPKWDGMMRLR